jgi:hypothetical protein
MQEWRANRYGGKFQVEVDEKKEKKTIYIQKIKEKPVASSKRVGVAISL